MERLVPLTKILMTLAVSVWAILLRDWVSLLALVVVELGGLFVAGLLFKQHKAVLALTSFAVFLGLIQQTYKDKCHSQHSQAGYDGRCYIATAKELDEAKEYSKAS